VSDNSVEPTDLDCKIVDGPTIVHALPTAAVRTFDDYTYETFIPYISQQLSTVKRVDIVWDRYVSGSLKEGTREERGKGERLKFTKETRLPAKWSTFLEDSSNKNELFNFLSNAFRHTSFPEGKEIHITSGELKSTRYQCTTTFYSITSSTLNVYSIFLVFQVST